ncbi:hypothetical protein B0J11DRAFT_188760 [Dendryphion nanum]|uniref:Uncharacterized protein n=1 Tax=Dendryphion nanum TaxID=256645 RepID=A0A9P9IA76_9PLEO|nr:hypothetical protein B0J11DRAFT_188760 [Dendryphion nanum]
MGDCSALPQEGERHYHVIRLQVAHERGIPDSAIALVPTTVSDDMSQWSSVSWAYWHSDQEGPVQCHTVCMRFSLNDSNGIYLQANIQHAQHLITIRGSRVTLVYEDLDLFAAICRKAKPLWDEHALIWTASPKTKYMLSKEENFGTWADQVLQKLCDKCFPEAFHWQSLPDKSSDILQVCLAKDEIVRLKRKTMEENEPIGFHEKMAQD